MNLKKVVAAMSVASGLGLVFGGAGSGVAIAAPCPPGGVAGAQCGGPGPGPQGGPPSAPQAGAAPPGRQEPPTDGAGNFRGLDGQQPDLPRRRRSDSPRSDFPGPALETAADRLTDRTGGKCPDRTGADQIKTIGGAARRRGATDPLRGAGVRPHAPSIPARCRRRGVRHRRRLTTGDSHANRSGMRASTSGASGSSVSGFHCDGLKDQQMHRMSIA